MAITKDTTAVRNEAQPVFVGETAADKRAEDKRKIQAALRAALAVPQNQRVLTELSKR